jgi:hypothetical protein
LNLIHFPSKFEMHLYKNRGIIFFVQKIFNKMTHSACIYISFLEFLNLNLHPFINNFFVELNFEFLMDLINLEIKKNGRKGNIFLSNYSLINS